MLTNEELARELSDKSTEGLWWLVNEIMSETSPTGEIDIGHLHLVGACLAELAHREPEIFDQPEIDEFCELVRGKLAAVPPVGHA